MTWFSPRQAGLSFGTCWQPSTGSQKSSVHGSLSVHIKRGSNTQSPVEGSHSLVVQMLLSSHTTGVVKQPVVESQSSSVHSSLSLQSIGLGIHAADPDAFGSQMNSVQGVLSGQRVTGVCFGVLAPTPAVLSGESCATPPVYCAVAVTNPPAMSAAWTVYGKGPPSSRVTVGSQPSPGPSPPMQGTSALMTCVVPFGSVRLNVPSENAQMSSESSSPFVRRAR